MAATSPAMTDLRIRTRYASTIVTQVAAVLSDQAPAKVNLTLRILGRRADGYHELESLVVFARLGDRLTLSPGGALGLDIDGPTAAAAGDIADNLVLRAANALAALIDGLRPGRFGLTKHLPVAAGLGGGSADAAAALRLLARLNDLAKQDPRLEEAARRDLGLMRRGEMVFIIKDHAAPPQP